MIIFAAPQTRPIAALRQYSENKDTLLHLDQKREAALKDEAKKVVDEIALYIEAGNHWFHDKFLLVGGLLGTFLTRLVFEKSRKTPHDVQTDEEIRLERLLTSPVTCTALAMGCIIAVMIDIHVRNNMTVIAQLGCWLAYYAEPTWLHLPYQQEPGDFLLWENFLRAGHGSMHNDDLYSLTNWPHLYSLTWLLYIFFAAMFQKLSLKIHKLRWIPISAFLLLHFTFFTFAWVSRAAPGNFEVQPIPFVDWWAYGCVPPLVSIIFWLFLMFSSGPYLWRLCQKPRAPEFDTAVHVNWVVNQDGAAATSLVKVAPLTFTQKLQVVHREEFLYNFSTPVHK